MISYRWPSIVPGGISPAAKGGAGACVLEIDQAPGVPGVPGVGACAAGFVCAVVASPPMNVDSDAGADLPHFLQAEALGGFCVLQ
jgi:hypothetical protein